MNNESVIDMNNREKRKGTIDYKTPYHWQAEGVSREIQLRRLQFAGKYIKPKDFVLDIGCGDGFLTNALSGLCERVIGIDTSATGISLAYAMADATNVNFAAGSINSLPFKENTFDVVTLFEVIEHISTGQAGNAIGEISRVLREEGKLILTTPNSRNLLNRILHRPLTSQKHEKEYSQTELLQLLNDFKQVEISGIYLPLPPFTLLSKSRYRFIWQILFPLGGWFPKLARFIAYCGRKK